MLDIQGGPVNSTADEFNMKCVTKQKIQAATAAAKALRSLSYSSAARKDLYLAGGIPLLTRLTLSIGGIQKDQQLVASSSQHNRAPSVAGSTVGHRSTGNAKSRYALRNTCSTFTNDDESYIAVFK